MSLNTGSKVKCFHLSLHQTTYKMNIVQGYKGKNQGIECKHRRSSMIIKVWALHLAVICSTSILYAALCRTSHSQTSSQRFLCLSVPDWAVRAPTGVQQGPPDFLIIPDTTGLHHKFFWDCFPMLCWWWCCWSHRVTLQTWMMAVSKFSLITLRQGWDDCDQASKSKATKW